MRWIICMLSVMALMLFAGCGADVSEPTNANEGRTVSITEKVGDEPGDSTGEPVTKEFEKDLPRFAACVCEALVDKHKHIPLDPMCHFDAEGRLNIALDSALVPAFQRELANLGVPSEKVVILKPASDDDKTKRTAIEFRIEQKPRGVFYVCESEVLNADGESFNLGGWQASYWASMNGVGFAYVASDIR